MNDSQFNTLLANHPLVSKPLDDISAQLETLKQLAISEIKAEVPDFWNRVEDSFTLPANTSVVDMRDEFYDYAYVKLLWTEDGWIEEMSEDEYTREYPDGVQTTAKPTIYVPKGDYKLKFAPTNSTATTINIVYAKETSDNTIDSVPDRWEHVVFYHILRYYDKPDNPIYGGVNGEYRHALAVMKNFAKETEQSKIKLIQDSFYSTIASLQSYHRGR